MMITEHEATAVLDMVMWCVERKHNQNLVSCFQDQDFTPQENPLAHLREQMIRPTFLSSSQCHQILSQRLLDLTAQSKPQSLLQMGSSPEFSWLEYSSKNTAHIFCKLGTFERDHPA